MTEEQLAELEALANAATSGPWRVSGVDDEDGHIIWSDADAEHVCSCYGKDDAAFVTTSRTAVPELIAEVRRLRRKVRGLYDAMSEMGVSDE